AESSAGYSIPLTVTLLRREREILMAGGLLKFLKAGGQEPIAPMAGDSAYSTTGRRRTVSCS
ncbi:MAG: hypothetical protein ACRDJL_12470, partial [Actinomycetota bacterium]